MDATPPKLVALPPGQGAADSPALRLIALLEIVAGSDRRHSLQSLSEETGWPKPTVHRMLQQLESAGLLQRDGDGRHYGTGTRLRRLAEDTLLHDSHFGARHAVLRQLVGEVGESCNLTALAGGEVIYLDRVETAAPLRFYLRAGSRVPAHCSASGKVILAQMAPAQRRKLLAHTPLQAYTRNTITDLDQLDAALREVRKLGYAIDDEEFLPGLVCLAVAVPRPHGPGNLCVALQGPVMRVRADTVTRWLPALQQAAQALAAIDGAADADPAQADHR